MHKLLSTTSHSIAWFHKCLERDELILRPPFQRNVVWSHRQKAYLIDTILREMPIPELYMQERTTDSGDQEYIVVDGQQRMTACMEYLSNEFPLLAADSPEWADQRFEDLGAIERKRIFEYSFVIRTLPEMDDDALRGIFRRLNRSTVALNQQELRNATYWGPFIQLMREFADDDVWDTLGVFTHNDVRRQIDVEFISELSICHLFGAQDRKKSLDKYYAAYDEEFPEEHRLRSEFPKVVGEIAQILPDIRSTRWRKKSDFYALFTLVGQHVKKLPLASNVRESLARALRKFGEAVALPVSVGKMDKHIVEYAAAVERSTSDLSRREARFGALTKWLEKHDASIEALDKVKPSSTAKKKILQKRTA